MGNLRSANIDQYNVASVSLLYQLDKTRSSGHCYAGVVMNRKDREELRRLYPELLDEELGVETLTAYVALIVQMAERRHAERKESNDGNGVN